MVVRMVAESSTQLEKRIEEVVTQCGYKLYDLDLPRNGSAVLRIFVSKPGVGGANSVNLDDCMAVNRAIDLDEEFIGLIPDNCTVEVSSPGVNRRLRTELQFREALGERVKLTLNSTEHGGVLKGILKEVSVESLIVEDEKSKDLIQIAWPELRRAQVEFVW